MNLSDKYGFTKKENDTLQTEGKYKIFIDPNEPLDKEGQDRLNEIMEKERMEIVSNYIDDSKDCKSYNDKVLVPTGNRVIVLPYEKNPYRVPMHMTDSGLIYGDTGEMRYKSDNTGEVEEAQKGIWCCKVVAIGNDCKSVSIEDDVYINFTFAAPLPFGDKGYYAISENNVICSVRLNN